MKKEKVFWGLVLILGGIFLIISKLGYFPDVNIFSILLTVFLVVVIVKSLLHILQYFIPHCIYLYNI
jgi:hypothetical protein